MFNKFLHCTFIWYIYVVIFFKIFDILHAIIKFCRLGLVGYDDCLTRSRSRVRFSEAIQIYVLFFVFCFFYFFIFLQYIYLRLFDLQQAIYTCICTIQIKYFMYYIHIIVIYIIYTNKKNGSMVQWHDSRFGCERSWVRFPLDPF